MGDKLRIVIGAVLLICAYLSMSQSPGCTRGVDATEIQIHQPATRAGTPYARRLGVVARHSTEEAGDFHTDNRTAHVPGHSSESRGNCRAFLMRDRLSQPSRPMPLLPANYTGSCPSLWVSVAGGRIERPPPGNEPGVVPLHQPAQS